MVFLGLCLGLSWLLLGISWLLLGISGLLLDISWLLLGISGLLLRISGLLLGSSLGPTALLKSLGAALTVLRKAHLALSFSLEYIDT